jgi:hypothetical protein
MIRRVSIMLLAAACSPKVPQRQPPSEPKVEQLAPAPAPPILPAGATPVAGLDSIKGEWRVAGVAGQPLSQPFGISASIKGGRVRFVSQCISRQYELSIDGGLVTARLIANETPDCARALTIDERGLEQAMGQVRTAYRLPSNALVFDGPAGAVTLFTQ